MSVGRLAWVTVGQVGSAVGSLALVKVLTTIFTQHQFGEFSLIQGGMTLVTGTVWLGFLQGYLRLGISGSKQDSFRACLLRLQGIALILIAVSSAVVSILFFIGHAVSASLGLFAYGAGELSRMRVVTEFQLLNLNLQYGTLLLVEAALRIAGLVALSRVCAIDVSEALLILGCISCLLSALYYVSNRSPASHNAAPKDRHDCIALWSFAAPLLPLSLFAWSYNVGDRYVIAAAVSVGAAGLYAAAYGLVSRPFFMLVQITETYFRQQMYSEIEREIKPSITVKVIWFRANLLLSLFIATFFSAFAKPVVSLILGPEFEQAATILPVVSFAHVLYVIAQPYIRGLYAEKQTQRVFLIELCAGLFAAASTFLLATEFGVIGAAWATFSTYFFYFLASRGWSRGRDLPKLNS